MDKSRSLPVTHKALCARLLLAGSLLFLSLPAPAIELLVTKARDLSFGGFAALNGGTVTVTPENVRSSTGSVWLMPSLNSEQARFILTGDSNRAFSVLLPADGTVVLTGPGSNMAVNSFDSIPSGVNGQLGTSGAGQVRVGATLTVNPGQTPGDYTGSFSITVNYN